MKLHEIGLYPSIGEAKLKLFDAGRCQPNRNERAAHFTVVTELICMVNSYSEVSKKYFQIKSSLAVYLCVGNYSLYPARKM